MSFNARKIFPLDTKLSTAIGVNIPFNGSAVFVSTFLTKDAIKANLLNYFLTNKKERYLNNKFGGNLRSFIFEQITVGNTDFLKSDLQSKINQIFGNIIVNHLNINSLNDSNSIEIKMEYFISNTSSSGSLEIIF